MDQQLLKAHMHNIQTKGWTRVEQVYGEDLIEKVKTEFAAVESEFSEIQRRKGIDEETKNATHHTVLKCPSMLALLDDLTIHPILEKYFGGKYILSTMGLSKIPPNGGVYTQNIHRDVRSNTAGVPLWINTLIMLDDSTKDNGATFMLEGSQNSSDKRDQEYFYKHAVRAIGKKGDVLLFDGNIWHSAGPNKTNSVRHIITPIYCRPFIKQQLDYPRAFGYDFADRISAHLRQVLGYNALVPTSIEDFYQKSEDRFYKSDQG